MESLKNERIAKMRREKHHVLIFLLLGSLLLCIPFVIMTFIDIKIECTNIKSKNPIQGWLYLTLSITRIVLISLILLWLIKKTGDIQRLLEKRIDDNYREEISHVTLINRAFYACLIIWLLY